MFTITLIDKCTYTNVKSIIKESNGIFFSYKHFEVFVPYSSVLSIIKEVK